MSFNKLGYQQLSLICAALSSHEKQGFLSCDKSTLSLLQRLSELGFVTYKKGCYQFEVFINYEKVEEHFNNFGIDIKVLQHIVFISDKDYYYNNSGLIGPFFTIPQAQESYLKSKNYLSQELNLIY